MTVRVLTAPAPVPDDGSVRIFLAGGITDCPLWQYQFVDLASCLTAGCDDLDITLVNPRRASFPLGDARAQNEQITWESRTLRRDVDVIAFWFCASSSDQPVATFELGRHAVRSDIGVAVGIDPAWHRASIFRAQLREDDALPSLRVYTRLYNVVARSLTLARAIAEQLPPTDQGAPAGMLGSAGTAAAG